MPLVVAERHSNERFVPAHLTEEAIELIKMACANVKVYRFTVYEVVDKENPEKPEKKVGTRTAVYTAYHMSEADKNKWRNKSDKFVHYDIVLERVINPRYVKLSETIERRETVYIKPAAFDWMPLNAINANFTLPSGITISDALAEAESKMNQAKALLGVAAASNVVL